MFDVLCAELTQIPPATMQERLPDVEAARVLTDGPSPLNVSILFDTTTTNRP